MHLDNIQFTKKVLIVLVLLSFFLVLGTLAWHSVQMLLLIFAGILFAIFNSGVADFLFGRLLPRFGEVSGPIIYFLATFLA